MNILYVIGGIVLLIWGIRLAVVKYKLIAKGEKDWLGSNVQLLGAGIMWIMIGLYLIIHYI